MSQTCQRNADRSKSKNVMIFQKKFGNEEELEKYVMISHIYINNTEQSFLCVQVLKTSMGYVSVLLAMKNK